MKIDYISDLHVSQHVPMLATDDAWETATKQWTRAMLDGCDGNILVIAGDLTEYNRQSIWVLEEAARHYERVFFVTGNHDRYLVTPGQFLRYGTSTVKVSELLDKASGIRNVTPLERKVVSYKKTLIAGDGLWYNLTTDQEIRQYLTQSSDAMYIREGVSRHEVPALLYKRAMDWYNTLEGRDIDVMVSHVPPVHSPMSPYKRDARFDCPVDFLVGKHWIAGHTHIRTDFEKAGTQFHIHTLGYPHESVYKKNSIYKPKQIIV